MSEVILNQIFSQLEMLEISELHQLNTAIHKYLVQKQATTQQATFHQALLTSGLVKKINYLSYSQLTKQRLIQVQGKPVSETIIAERR
ncbi:MAG: hypothetical protein MUE44_07270 [Oscillatoriaceae cyanobacterium Prado104]|jgi:hypothetical protein|nr:hypothetical protein [Oscillatoriaceae cyanobacterium Prado104]